MKLAQVAPWRERSSRSDIDLLESIASGLWIPERLLLPTSWVGHVPFGSWLIKALQPRTVVELGVHTGNSFFTFAEASVRHALPVQLYGIDTWGGDEHAGRYEEDVFADVCAYAASRFADRVHLIRKRFEDAVEDFADGSIDLLHIDGLHTYEAVRGDFEAWRCKLSDRAVVLFHDISVMTEGFGVARFWAEISAAYPYFAFTHSNGLGVLLVGSQVPVEVTVFAEQRASLAACHLFAKIGNALCRVLEHGPDVTALPVDSTLDPPRVYLSDSDAFDESHGADLTPVAGRPGVLQRDLAIHPATASLRLRIDPMNRQGIRGVQRVLLVPRDGGAPVALVASDSDHRAHLKIVPVDGGTLFVGLADDSQWYPALDSAARGCIAGGATLVLEPMAVPNPMLGRLLLRAVDTLFEPLQSRIAQLQRLEQRETIALTRHEQALSVSDSELGVARGLARDLEQALLASNSELTRVRAEERRLNDDIRRLQDRLTLHSIHDRIADDAIVVVDRLRKDANRSIARVGDVLSRLADSDEMRRGASIVLQQKYAAAIAGQDRALQLAGVPFILEPIRGVVPIDQQGRRWRAVDDDPQFALPELCDFRGHWISISIALEFHALHAGSPVIYLDSGTGMSDQFAIKMPRPVSGIGSTSIVLPVPAALIAARFDPCSGPSEFALTSVTITPLSKWEAIATMARAMRPTGHLRRLWDDHRATWRSLRHPRARTDLKTDFVQAYRQAVCNVSSTYADWIRLFELPAHAYDSLIAARAAWPRLPLISLLMPTYNTPARLLREAIESVIEQNYPRWELCIADDASTAPHVRRILEDAAHADSRVKLRFRTGNGHISAASNDALSLAGGEFVALLDHDDRLHPLALHFMAEAILDHPDAKLFFSDEDKITMDGVRHHPHFKSAFNDPLILAQNAVNHLGCYAIEGLKEVGGFRPGYEGAQDWDLVLRMYERFGASRIVHVPRVLYHWREVPGSTAVATTEKPYAESAGRRAVADYLARRGIEAAVLPAPDVPAWNRIRFSIPDAPPRVTIVIPTRDKADILAVCVDSILAKTTYPDYEIVIVDNGSVESATETYLRQLPADRVRVVRDDSPFNYSRINNDAVRQATGTYICLLNNDTEVLTPDWLEEMMGLALQPEVGIVGARLWYPDGRVQHAGVVLGIGGVAGHVHRLAARTAPGYFGRAILQQQFSAVTAACLLISRHLWDEIEGLDEALEVAFNDIDLCVRATAAGKKVVWTPFAELVHHESLSRGIDDTPQKTLRFEAEKDLMRRRWKTVLDNDLFYSPNLSLVPADDFTLSWEPRPSSSQ